MHVHVCDVGPSDEPPTQTMDYVTPRCLAETRGQWGMGKVAMFLSCRHSLPACDACAGPVTRLELKPWVPQRGVCAAAISNRLVTVATGAAPR